jgi:hypothetical protein
MRELIRRRTADRGVERAAAQTAAGVARPFLVKECRVGEAQALIDDSFGAKLAAAQFCAGSDNRFGDFDGVMGAGGRTMPVGSHGADVVGGSIFGFGRFV